LNPENVPRYQPEQLEPSRVVDLHPSLLDPLAEETSRLSGPQSILAKRRVDIGKKIQESEESLHHLEKAQNNLRAIQVTRILNRANNLFTNAKDYAVLEAQNQPTPSKTKTALQSTEAFLGGL
jgi:hypothetical protein